MKNRGVAGIALALLVGLACARPSIPPPAPAEPADTTPAAPATTPSRPALLPRTLHPAPEPPAAPLPPVPAPEIRYTDLAGLRRELAALRAHHRPVLVNFWATWCGACRVELPLLGDLGREWGDGGPAILGVSVDLFSIPDEDLIKGRVRQMLASHRVSYPNRIVRGRQQEVFDAFGIAAGLPFSILYDGQGTIVRRYVGAVAVEEVRAIARAMAAGSAPAASAGAEAGG